MSIRKLFATTLLALLLGSGVGLAQNVYAGGSSGIYASAGTLFTLDGYLGFEDILTQDLDIRANIGLIAAGDLNAKFAADVIYGFDLDQGGPLSLHVGGGPRVYTGFGDSDFAIGSLAYVEYDLDNSDVSLFGEVDFDIFIDGATDAIGGFKGGLLYHF